MSTPSWVHLGWPGRVLDDGGGAGRQDGPVPAPDALRVPAPDASVESAPVLLQAAAASHGSAEPMLEALGTLPVSTLPRPGHGHTRTLWELLASVAAVDLVAARVLEPHLDALAILDQAGVPAPAGVLGVYASESGGQTPTAHPVTRADDVGPAGAGTAPVGADEGLATSGTGPGTPDAGSAASGAGPADWALTGTKPWCSLAECCAAAVVTAALLDGGRRAFLVDLTDPGVSVGRGAWPALGLAAIVSTPVTFHAVPARPVGGASWYLDRPGFAWGGMGVAAVWFGGAVHLYRTLASVVARREPDQFALAALGRADRLLAAVSAQLAAAADAIDAGTLTGPAAEREAYRLRGTVAQVCTEVIDVVGQATGPGPLTGDADHARAVADLQVYIRQHHAGRDDARLGALLAAGRDAVAGAEAGDEPAAGRRAAGAQGDRGPDARNQATGRNAARSGADGGRG